MELWQSKDLWEYGYLNLIKHALIVVRFKVYKADHIYYINEESRCRQLPFIMLVWFFIVLISCLLDTFILIKNKNWKNACRSYESSILCQYTEYKVISYDKQAKLKIQIVSCAAQVYHQTGYGFSNIVIFGPVFIFICEDIRPPDWSWHHHLFDVEGHQLDVHFCLPICNTKNRESYIVQIHL